MNQNTVNFVTFRQAVYSSYHKLLLVAALVLAFVWSAENALVAHATKTAEQNLAVLKAQEPHGTMSSEYGRWQQELKIAEDALQAADGIYFLLAVILSIAIPLFCLTAGMCAMRACVTKTEEHEAYCSALLFPFLRAYWQWLRNVR